MGPHGEREKTSGSSPTGDDFFSRAIAPKVSFWDICTALQLIVSRNLKLELIINMALWSVTYILHEVYSEICWLCTQGIKFSRGEEWVGELLGRGWVLKWVVPFRVVSCRLNWAVLTLLYKTVCTFYWNCDKLKHLKCCYQRTTAKYRGIVGKHHTPQT